MKLLLSLLSLLIAQLALAENEIVLQENFENEADQKWIVKHGSMHLDSSDAYSGEKSFSLREGNAMITFRFGALKNATCTVRFKDDLDNNNLGVMVSLATKGRSVSIGLAHNASNSHYCYSVTKGWSASKVKRSSEWNEFKFVLKNGTCKLYISGIHIATDNKIDEVYSVRIGGFNASKHPNKKANIYFDDIKVVKH